MDSLVGDVEMVRSAGISPVSTRSGGGFICCLAHRRMRRRALGMCRALDQAQ
jgi:hypothetical protein